MTFSSNSHSSTRKGISLFEVLISILVATIGVFGVLVLIPFAVKNAQLGMDREAAINAAKNFTADFQAYGYHNPYYNPGIDPNWPSSYLPGWRDDDTTPHLAGLPNTPVNTTNNIVPSWPYLIDPIGCATLTSAGFPYGQFPDTGAESMFPDCPQINRITVLDPLLNPLGVDLARRLCMPQDGLVFDEPLTEMGPPQQNYYDLDGDALAKRQYKGKYTTVAFAVPLDDICQRYRIYTLVLSTGDRDRERLFEVTGVPDPTDVAPLGTRELEGIGLGGGDLEFTERFPSNQRPPAEQRAIRNNDWVMLMSFYQAGPPPYDRVRLNFYSMLHAEHDDPAANNDIFHVTLQGPDFDFWRDWTPGLNNTTPPGIRTFAVLIPNVLAVYERTIRMEPQSDWQYRLQ